MMQTSHYAHRSCDRPCLASCLPVQNIGELAFIATALPQSIRGGLTSLTMTCSYALYMRHTSDQQRRELCFRSWSSDSVELYFSALNASLNGQKPTPQLVDQHFKCTDVVANAKADSDIGFHVPHSHGQQYSCHALQKDESWNNNRALTDSAVLEKRMHKMERVAKGKHTVRGFHK